MMRRSITCLIGVWAVSALLTLSPLTAHAIPAAGDYVFTSGLIGTFTSDGASLTDWNFTDPNNRTWTPLVSTPLLNSEFEFTQTSAANVGIQIAWMAGVYTSSGGASVSPQPMNYQPRQSVPEPSGLALLGLGLGLLVLVGYVRRQRHQAEFQIG